MEADRITEKVVLEDVSGDDTTDEFLNQGDAYEKIEPDTLFSSTGDDFADANSVEVISGQMSSDEYVRDMEISDRIFEDRQHQEVVRPLVYGGLWNILKRGSINLILPFINGIMLGFGEILAHEIGFKYNWVGARVQPPRRMERRNRPTTSRFL